MVRTNFGKIAYVDYGKNTQSLSAVKDIKIISVLKSFDAALLRRWLDYVSSPYFNKREQLTSLARALCARAPFKEHTTDEDLHALAFPGESFDYRRFKNRTSDLYALTLDFLALEGGLADPRQTMLARLRMLRELRLHDVFVAELRKSHGILEALVRDDRYFDTRAAMCEEELLLNTLISPAERRSLLQDELDLRLTAVVIKALRLYTLMLHEQRINTIGFQATMESSILEAARSVPVIAEQPTVRLLVAMFDLERLQTTEQFYRLRDVLAEVASSVVFMDRYMAYVHLGGFCMHRYNIDGDEEFAHLAFQLNCEKIDTGIIHEGNILYPDLMVTIRLGAVAGEYDKARAILDRFLPVVQPSDRHNCEHFAEGILALYAGQYDDALRHLSMCSFDFHIFKVQVRTFTLQALLASGNTEQAVALADSFRHYLAKDKDLHPLYREGLKDFVRLAPRLAVLSASPSEFKLANKRKKLMAEASAMSSNVFGIRGFVVRMLQG